MLRVTRSRTLPVPAATLWDIVSRPERLSEWLPYAESVEVLEGSGVDQRRRMHGHWGKRRSEIDQRITVWEPERRMAWVHEAERLDGRPAPRFAASTTFTVELEPVGESTVVTLTSEQEPASRLRGLVMRMFSPRELGGAYERALDALEAATRPVPAA